MRQLRSGYTALLVLALSGLPSVQAADAVLAPVSLKTEYAIDPLGIDARTPRLSWQGSADARDVHQTAYQIQAAASPAALAAGELLWDSGSVKSSQSVFVPYAGPALQSGQRVTWHVRVWDQDGNASDWSDAGSWEMGLLEGSDWISQWVTPAGEVDASEQRPVVQMRNTFALKGAVQRARLYATARGVYALELNGQPVGDQVLAPGWTSYGHRIQYQTYDVTDLLASGENAIGAMLADGWYRDHLAWDGKRNHYGDQTALRLQLHITYTDGSETVIGTDPSWRATSEGPWRGADIYNGEVYDARRLQSGWSSAGFDDVDWGAVAVLPADDVALIAPQGPPVRRIEEITPIAITTPPNGETLVDFGQNMVGWVRLRVQGESGTEVVLRHAEVLDEEGNLYTDNLRGARQTDHYTLAGGGVETYEPRFTFHGFRYVGIRGVPGTLTPEDITGIVVHSDMARTGTWDSSDSRLNQLYHNIVWGQKGNFLDVPTDCPQRDERLGWTGDAQVFAPTAAFNMDVSGFFAKWLADVALDQTEAGSVPHVVPHMLEEGADGTAGWADVATVIPWAMYRAYDDRALLERQFPSMVAWVEYVRGKADDDLVWRPGWQFGDWLSPQFVDVFAPYRAVTGTDLIATAYFAHSADLVSRAAGVLGKKTEQRRYRTLFEDIRKAFQHEFLTASGRLAYETQTSYVLALAFDLVPESARQVVADRLAADVRERGNHLTTGFLGTPALTRVLSDNGLTDVAYDLLTQTSYPSWLYPIEFGATTIWERWDAVRTDGSFNSPEMTSFNHYAYGAIGQWMVEVVAGLDKTADGQGYKKLLIHPRPGGGLKHASAALETAYGSVASHWAIKGDEFTLDVTVAPNTTATVVLPLAAGEVVTEAGAPLADTPGVRSQRALGRNLQLEIGSGRYAFSYRSMALVEQASGFSPFDRSTMLADIIGDAVARELLEPLAPALFGNAVPASMQARSISGVAQYAPEMVQQALDLLPEINDRRRARLLE